MRWSKQSIPFYIIHNFPCYPRDQMLRKHFIFFLKNPVVLEQSQQVHFPQQCTFSRIHKYVCFTHMYVSVKTRQVSYRILLCSWGNGSGGEITYTAVWRKRYLVSIWLKITWIHIMKSNLVPAYNWVCHKDYSDPFYSIVLLSLKCNRKPILKPKRRKSTTTFLSLNLSQTNSMI